MTGLISDTAGHRPPHFTRMHQIRLTTFFIQFPTLSVQLQFLHLCKHKKLQFRILKDSKYFVCLFASSGFSKAPVVSFWSPDVSWLIHVHCQSFPVLLV